MSMRRRILPNAEAGKSALPLWGAVCFLTSGAAGLLYEVVWSKQLSYALGNSLHAAATVVAAFLCGLALGARVLGVPLARRGNGPRVYAGLEVAVGLLGIASLPVLRGLEPAFGALYRLLGGETVPFAAARFVILFVLLLPPTALMGATLPVLVGHFERGRVGPALARLYAVNTLGAVAGTVAGGFVLLPWLGLRGTTHVAAALNVAVALLAWAASSRSIEPAPTSPGATHPRAPAKPGAPPALTARHPWLFAALFALSGFIALAFQIAWIRLFGLMFGSSVYSFSAVLGVYLLGLALGSAAIASRLRRPIAAQSFGWLQLLLAVAAALGLLAFRQLPEWTYDLAEAAGPRWAFLWAGEIGFVAVLLLVPCVLFGAAFPLAARLLQHGDGGHAAGFAYAVNTAGTIAGALIAGFVLVPNWGPQGTHVAALLLSLAIGLAWIGFAGPPAPSVRQRAAMLGAIAVVVALVALAPPWDPALMSAGVYRPVQASHVAGLAGEGGSSVWRATRNERVLYYREGLNGSVMVGASLEDSTRRWLRVGGKVDASTSDMPTQVLLGLLPAACADSGAATLVVGHGSGITTAAALAAGAGRTEVVEIERGVIEASRFFHTGGEDPLDDPRVHLVIGDARTHLAYGTGQYQVIISEPSNPWISGVNNLFTVDFYRKVRARLAPGGVFCQWIQLYELSPETFGSMAASYLEVFPEGQVFAIWRAGDVLLMALPGNRRLALERLSQAAVSPMLRRAGIDSPEALAAYYAGPLSELRALARDAPLNRDDRPVVEYRAPRDLVTVGRVSSRGDSLVRGRLPFSISPRRDSLFAGWPVERWYEVRARGLADMDEPDRAQQVLRAARAEGWTETAVRVGAEIETETRRRRARAELDEALRMTAAGRADMARLALERAADADPGNAMTWALVANQRRIAGDLSGAEAALARIGVTSDSSARAEAELVSGMIETDRGRLPAAADRFRSAQGWRPNLAKTYVLEAYARRRAGDLVRAREALERGLARLPGDSEISQAMAELARSDR